MGLGLAFRCFWAALSGGDTEIRMHRAVDNISDPPTIKEIIREVIVPSKDAPPPIIKEVPGPERIITREVIKEVPVEVIREVIKEVIKEVPGPEVIREVVKEVIKEVPGPEVIREVIKEVPGPEVIREVEVVREVPKEMIKETIREVPKETIREVIKLVPDTHGPAQLLALLQQDGRLVDFLNEEIENYDDDQIGAAVREIHSKTRKALHKYMTLEPVRPEKEGDVVSIGAGYDPSAIRVTGRVSEKTAMFGTLRHRGWKVTKVELPPRPSGADPTIVMPAEVEVE